MMVVKEGINSTKGSIAQSQVNSSLTLDLGPRGLYIVLGPKGEVKGIFLGIKLLFIGIAMLTVGTGARTLSKRVQAMA